MEDTIMFTHMIPVKTIHHEARNEEYELNVYQVVETKEYQIFISKSGEGVGDIYTASEETVKDAKEVNATDMVDKLIEIAKEDINRNEYDQY